MNNGIARNNTCTSSWVCDRLISHKDVLKAEPIEEGLIRLTVKDMYSEVLVATMSQPLVSLANIPACCHQSGVQFLLNIPKNSLFEGDIIEFAGRAPFGIGGLGDLYTAINEKELCGYIPKEVRFILRGLRQHTAVSRVERVNSRLYLIHRHLHDPLRVLALNEYDLTADAVRNGFDKYGMCNIVLTSNPNCRPSPESIEAARHCGARVLSWGPFLGSLNHE